MLIYRSIENNVSKVWSPAAANSSALGGLPALYIHQVRRGGCVLDLNWRGWAQDLRPPELVDQDQLRRREQETMFARSASRARPHPAVAQRLGDVHPSHALRAFHVGQRARDP